MWLIHGKKYDLTAFINKHPGGADILMRTKDQEDISALFETSHAFSNKLQINWTLNKYEIIPEDLIESNSSNLNKIFHPAMYSTSYNFNHYDRLVDQIRTLYPNRSSIKAPVSYYLRNLIVLALYIWCFYLAMFSDLNTLYRCLLSFVASLCWISLGFNVMHDASHNAICSNVWINIILAKLWNSWGCWNRNIWFYHHVMYHHQFTGLVNDPNVYHYRPMARKNKTDKPIFGSEFGAWMINFVSIIFPGFYYGQSISYSLASRDESLFGIKLPSIAYYNVFDKILIVIHLACLYQGLWLPTIIYMIANNLFYHLNVAFGHDMYETSVRNHYEGKDWFLLCVRNSGNFLNQSMLWTLWFGGSNYQIEHHLFPTMSHVHYPVIAPIVRSYCRENSIPYVHHPTLTAAYRSFLKTMEFNS